MAGVGGGHSGGGGIGGGGHGGGGFGGGHHGGGGIGGGHHGGGGFGGHHGGGFGGMGGGFHGGHHNPHGHHRPHGHGGWFFGGPMWYGPRRRTSGCGGLLVVPIIIFFIVVIIFNGVVYESNIPDKIGFENFYTEIISMETEEAFRKKLSAEYVEYIDGYFTDELDLLEGDATGQVTELMQAFHEMSGIKPYLYITDNIFGYADPDTDTIENWLYETYYKLFGDEAHFLLLYLTDLQAETYQTWYIYGDDTTAVFEPYEWESLLNFIDQNYMLCRSYDEMFAQSFNDMISTYEPSFITEAVTDEFVTVTTIPVESVSADVPYADESETLMITDVVTSHATQSVVTDIYVSDAEREEAVIVEKQSFTLSSILIVAVLVLAAVAAIVFLRKKNTTADDVVDKSGYKEPWE